MKLLISRLLCVAPVLAAVLMSDFARAQPGYTQVGPAPAGRVDFEYVGMVNQTDSEFETYGYFTYIRGLRDEALFFDTKSRDEKNARFTFQSQARMTGRSVVGKVFNVNADGTLVVYQRLEPDPDATFASADHFKSHFPIASFRFRGQSVVTVTSPNVGVNSAVLEATSTKDSWRQFTWNGANYVLGRPGVAYRFSHTGRGDRSQQEPPIAKIAIAGHAIALGR